jgi:hypothetical protein
MKALPILVTFCLLQALMCVSLEVTTEALYNAVKKSAPFLKVFHQETLNINPRDTLSNVKLQYSVLNPWNIQFRFDDFGLLHIKYVNLKIKVTGTSRVSIIAFRLSSNFNAELSNFSWEQIYAVKVNDKGNGKVELKQTKTSEGEANYNVNKLTLQANSKVSGKELETNVKAQIKLLNLDPLKQQLRKVTDLILETLQTDLNK